VAQETGKIDHLRLILDADYLRRYQRKLATYAGTTHLTVLHEPADECCALEPWETTRARLLQSIAGVVVLRP
jgi:hypothetical protein